MIQKFFPAKHDIHLMKLDVNKIIVHVTGGKTLWFPILNVPSRRKGAKILYCAYTAHDDLNTTAQLFLLEQGRVTRVSCLFERMNKHCVFCLRTCIVQYRYDSWFQPVTKWQILGSLALLAVYVCSGNMAATTYTIRHGIRDHWRKWFKVWNYPYSPHTDNQLQLWTPRYWPYVLVQYNTTPESFT